MLNPMNNIKSMIKEMSMDLVNSKEAGDAKRVIGLTLQAINETDKRTALILDRIDELEKKIEKLSSKK